MLKHKWKIGGDLIFQSGTLSSNHPIGKVLVSEKRSIRDGQSFKHVMTDVLSLKMESLKNLFPNEYIFIYYRRGSLIIYGHNKTFLRTCFVWLGRVVEPMTCWAVSPKISGGARTEG